MHVQNLKLFQNPPIYCLISFYENDIIIPANLFSSKIIVEFEKFTVNFQNNYFPISKMSYYSINNLLIF